MSEPRPNTAVRRFALARLASATGSAASFAALNYVVFESTRSSAWLAATLLLTFGTVAVVSPATGMLGDRFDRKAVMIASDLSVAVAFAAMAFVESIGLIVGLAFLATLVHTAFPAAAAGALPNLVPDEALAHANSTLEVAGQAGFILGPLLGGAAVPSVGAGTVFLGNAASFIVSAALIGSVAGRFAREQKHDAKERSVLSGVRLLVRVRVLRAVAIIYFAISLGIGITIVANVPLARSLGVGSLGYGSLIAVWGAGSVLGALAGRTMTAASEPGGFFAGCALVGLAAGGVVVSPWFALALLALALMGLGDGIAAVASAGIVQRTVRDHVRSRVVGSLSSILAVGLVLSYVLAVPVLSLVGPRGSYAIGALISLAPMPFLIRAFFGRPRP